MVSSAEQWAPEPAHSWELMVFRTVVRFIPIPILEGDTAP